MKIIVVCNRKGGCGKSSTAGAMFSYLGTVAHKRVALVDFDSQCNVSYALGGDLAAPSLYDVLTGCIDIRESLQAVPEDVSDSYLLAGSDLLSNIDNGTDTVTVNFREELQKLENLVDYVIVDTAPALALLTGLALSVADNVVVPVVADIYNIQGMQGIGELVSEVNPEASIIGILMTRYRGRLLAVQKIEEMAGDVAEQMGVKLFSTKIREGVTVVEAAMMRKGLFSYDPEMKSNVAQDYAAFMEEFLKEVGSNGE